MAVDWNLLIDEQALAALLAAPHARYARPVAEGLVVFLSGLPEKIQQQILLRQSELPLDASLAKRLGVLGACSPVLQKLGQTLARDKRLALALRKQLRTLESMTPTTPLSEIERVLAEELGPLDRRGVALLRPALAEASVAVVIPFRQETPSGPRDGVFKVLKPGIEERLALELDLLSRVGEHMDRRRRELALPEIEYQETFQRIRERLLNEVQLTHEQENLAAAARFFSGDSAILIPEVYPLSTPRVTAMQRVYGVKVADHPLHCRRRKQELAAVIAGALIARPLLSPQPLALFHCDPHAGNLLYADDGRVAILDWSLAGRLGARERDAMVQILAAAWLLNRDKILAALDAVAERPVRYPNALAAVVDGRLRQVRRGRLPGFTWAVEMLDEAVQLAGLSAPADLVLFRKTLLTLEGVMGDLRAHQFCIDGFLTTEFIKQFVRELPVRPFAAPTARTFGTRLSNLDLASVACDATFAGTRFWAGECRDFFAAVHRAAAKHPHQPAFGGRSSS